MVFPGGNLSGDREAPEKDPPLLEVLQESSLQEMPRSFCTGDAVIKTADLLIQEFFQDIV